MIANSCYSCFHFDNSFVLFVDYLKQKGAKLSDINKKLTIGIFGHYGNCNLGDEAIIEATIENLRVLRPNVQLYGFSINPDDTSQRYNIPAYPIRGFIKKKANVKSPDNENTPTTAQPEVEVAHTQTVHLPSIKDRLKKIPGLGLGISLLAKSIWLSREIIEEIIFLKASYKIVKELDILMITGSNQFLDNFGGPMGFPYTLLKWSFLARIAGTKVAYVSVGAGPIYKTASKILIRLALLFSNYTSFRDTPSQALIQSFGFKGKSYVYPDLAHSVILNDLTHQKSAVAGKRTVSINPMPVYDSRYWYESNDKLYESYVCKLAGFSAELIIKGHPVFLYATQPKDENVIDDILTQVRELGIPEDQVKGMMKKSRDLKTFFENLSETDIAVTTRFHGALLALFAEKPLLAICYYRKTDDLMKEYGQGASSLVFEDMTIDEMMEKFSVLEENYEEEKQKIVEKNKIYRERLDEQYLAILDLVG